MKSKETHTQTQKAAEETQKHRNNSARKANERYYSGLYSSNFHPKASKFYRQELPTLVHSLGRQQCLVVMEKSGKRRLTCPTLKKEGLGVGGGDRGKVLRELGEDGHRRRRRIWRACFGRILELPFEVHIPDQIKVKV